MLKLYWVNKMKLDIEDNSILIIPNDIKDNVLNYLRNNKKDMNIKVMDLNTFIKALTFDYNEETIYNLMKIENISYDIATLYLDNIRYINEDIKDNKMKKLINIKDSIDNKLIKNKLFRKLIKNKNIYIYGYDYVNKYQKYILDGVDNLEVINKDYKVYDHDVYKFNNLEDEVIFVAEEICNLLDNGVDINNIFVSNTNTDYDFIMKKIFNMYNIPINIKNTSTLYQTEIGKYFINNLCNDINKLLDSIKEKYDMNNVSNKNIYNKLINVVNKFYFTDDYVSVKDIIINVMKNTKLDSVIYKNAVNNLSIVNNIIDDNKYVFLVGFNLNSIPVTVKDEDYISDNIKPSFLEKSYELNVINKELYYKIISNIKNLYISYKEKYLNESFFPSLLIDEYKMNVIDKSIDYSNYSDILNRIKTTHELDNLIRYNTHSKNLDVLYSNYKIDYNTYDNRFSGINKNSLYEYLNNSLNLSFSSMDNYYHCQFKFYLSNILKLDYFEEKIQTYIGNLFHYVLSKCLDSDIDVDKVCQYYIENNIYPKSFKNEYFLSRIIDEIKFVVNIIKYQNTLMNMDSAKYEEKVNVDKSDVINITFKGFIDKLLLKDNYAVIIDYKTYKIDVDLNYLPYGLSMQLPVYLYLTKNIEKDYKIIGFYLQQVLFNKFSKVNGKTLKELKKDNLKLKGYSLGNESILSNLDSTLENSELIHSMKITDKGFYRYANTLTENQIDNIVKITNNKIDECINGIENADFTINPKKINGKNIGCNYCKFKDICYMTNRDICELEDIKDLDYLN